MSNSFDDLEAKITQNASPGIRPGLARLARLLKKLDNPQRAFKSVLIVGTNGKGSTGSTLESLYRASGFKTALYTSPHLECVSERVRIDGRTLDARDWSAHLDGILSAVAGDDVLKDDRPSYFELLTALAFCLIAAAKPDIAIMEAGMGGRLDAVNLLCLVQAVICASLGLDHTEYLGDTIEQIAAEKFAVIRPDKPAIYAPQTHILHDMFIKRAELVSAIPIIAKDEGHLTQVTFGGTKFHWEGQVFHTPLVGTYQADNARLAMCTFKTLTGIDDFNALQRGLDRVFWPGRMERIGDVLLDGAHNPHGIEGLVNTLSALSVKPDEWNLIFSSMKDKDFSSSLSRLRPFFGSIWCAGIPQMPRAAQPNETANAALLYWPKDSVHIAQDALCALKEARQNAQNGKKILACGSLYMVGLLRKYLKN